MPAAEVDDYPQSMFHLQDHRVVQPKIFVETTRKGTFDEEIEYAVTLLLSRNGNDSQEGQLAVAARKQATFDIFLEELGQDQINNAVDVLLLLFPQALADDHFGKRLDLWLVRFIEQTRRDMDVRFFYLDLEERRQAKAYCKNTIHILYRELVLLRLFMQWLDEHSTVTPMERVNISKLIAKRTPISSDLDAKNFYYITTSATRKHILRVEAVFLRMLCAYKEMHTLLLPYVKIEHRTVAEQKALRKDYKRVRSSLLQKQTAFRRYAERMIELLENPTVAD